VRFIRAQSLAEATDNLSREPLRVLAGGTDLAIEYRRALPDWNGLLHVGRIPELRAIDVTPKEIRIGAAVPYSEILGLEAGDGALAALREAAATIGSPGIMNLGSLGGNLGTASPSGDGSLALLALDATVNVASSSSMRSIPIDRFFIGPRRSVLRADELIVSVTIPRMASERRESAFRKVGNRDGSILSVAAVAVSLSIDAQNLCSRACVAFGAVAPTPRRAPTVENLLVGKPFDALASLELNEAVWTDIKPVDDQRSTAWYRREVVPVLLRDAVSIAYRRLVA
jgi:CO/xanthine dehydrogenase FAD-binding subunit